MNESMGTQLESLGFMRSYDELERVEVRAEPEETPAPVRAQESQPQPAAPLKHWYAIPKKEPRDRNDQRGEKRQRGGHKAVLSETREAEPAAETPPAPAPAWDGLVQFTVPAGSCACVDSEGHCYIEVRLTRDFVMRVYGIHLLIAPGSCMDKPRTVAGTLRIERHAVRFHHVASVTLTVAEEPKRPKLKLLLAKKEQAFTMGADALWLKPFGIRQLVIARLEERAGRRKQGEQRERTSSAEAQAA